MVCNWIKKTTALQKGIALINSLEDTKFEQFLRRIVSKLKYQDADNIFTEDERNKLQNMFKVDKDDLILTIKSIIYIFKKILKFVFMPVDLKNDLMDIGLNEEKSDYFVKIWSAETGSFLNKFTLNSDKYEENPSFTWKLSAEISSDYNKKSKIPKAYLKVKGDKNICQMELTHGELHSMFLQFETIQNDLDNLLSNY